MRIALLLLSVMSLTGCDFIGPVKTKQFDTLNIYDTQSVLNDEQRKSIQKKIEDKFTFNINITSKDIDYASSHNVERDQYDIEKIFEIDGIVTAQESDYDIYVLSSDIYMDGYHFLFAQTDFERAITLLSLHRFSFVKQEDQNRVSQILEDRLYKLLLRRVGLMLGAKGKDCVMAHSNSLFVLDALTPDYCGKSLKYLKRIDALRHKEE